MPLVWYFRTNIFHTRNQLGRSTREEVPNSDKILFSRFFKSKNVFFRPIAMLSSTAALVFYKKESESEANSRAMPAMHCFKSIHSKYASENVQGQFFLRDLHLIEHTIMIRSRSLCVLSSLVLTYSRIDLHFSWQKSNEGYVYAIRGCAETKNPKNSTRITNYRFRAVLIELLCGPFLCDSKHCFGSTWIFSSKYSKFIGCKWIFGVTKEWDLQEE